LPLERGYIHHDVLRRFASVDTVELHKADWGGQELVLKDPDGNIVMFLA